MRVKLGSSDDKPDAAREVVCIAALSASRRYIGFVADASCTQGSKGVPRFVGPSSSNALLKASKIARSTLVGGSTLARCIANSGSNSIRPNATNPNASIIAAGLSVELSLLRGDESSLGKTAPFATSSSLTLESGELERRLTLSCQSWLTFALKPASVERRPKSSRVNRSAIGLGGGGKLTNCGYFCFGSRFGACLV